MTPSHSDDAARPRSPLLSSIVADLDQYGRATAPGVQNSVARSESSPTTTSSHEARHWRVQFLRNTARVSSARGIAGITPPYCPFGPTLYRSLHEEVEELVIVAPSRRSSPLAINSLTAPPSLVITNHGDSVFSDIESMPHASNLPNAGFQALILCGPGIGLSTFTSVPNEHPKALINVANRPMVWYVLDWCYRMGVTNITLITPPSAKGALTAALGQNPYLTSLPSPSPDLLAPADLEFTTPTAELLRLPEVQKIITSDFLLLPCDLVSEVSGVSFLETYLSSLSGLGGVGPQRENRLEVSSSVNFSLGGEGSGRRGGLSIWYNTADRDESVKGEECDFMATTALDSHNRKPHCQKPDDLQGTLRKLVMTMPMSELWDTVERDKGWKIRQSLLRKHGAVKCTTRLRDSHIYFFPRWVKEFAAVNEDFESVSEDLVGTWANAEWRKPGYRAKYGVQQIFIPAKKSKEDSSGKDRSITDELDLLSLSSTQVTRHAPNVTELPKQVARLASRVQIDLGSRTISPDHDEDEEVPTSASIPIMPPILSYVLPTSPTAPLVRRVDTTPLLLSVSLLLAKIPSVEESIAAKSTTTSSLAHAAKVAGTATVAPRVTISRADTLIDSNSTIATQCVIKSSCIGSAVSVGIGSRITGCVIMDGATIGEKCVLTNTVVGKKAKIGKGCILQNCEVQDGNAVSDKTEGKGEKYLVGGLEDDFGSDDMVSDNEGGGDGDKNSLTANDDDDDNEAGISM